MICFQKLHMGVYLRTKFQVSSMILTGFRLGGGGGGGGNMFTPPKQPYPPPLPASKRNPKMHTQIRVNPSGGTLYQPLASFQPTP